MGEAIQVGDVYSVAGGGGMFGVAKVLALEPESNIVWVHTFKAKFPTRPTQAALDSSDPEWLTNVLGSSIGALPITPRVLEFWQPVFMFRAGVTDEENDDLREGFGRALPWDDLIYS